MPVAVYEQMLTAAQAAIADLTLDGVDPENVVGKALPVLEEGDPLPRVLVCPGGAEDSEHRSGEHDWVYFSVLIVIIAAANADYATWRGAVLRWREQIRAALNHNKWEDAPRVFGVDINHAPPVDADLLGHNTIWSAIEFRYRASEART